MKEWLVITLAIYCTVMAFVSLAARCDLDTGICLISAHLSGPAN